MELVDFVRLGGEAPVLGFLIIGGYAVAAHGHTRATFDRMWQASEERDFGGVRARVPCLDHLLALKLHALKQSLPHRTSKDAEDVETLCRRNGLNLSDPRYEQLFLKYGSRELYDSFVRLLRNP